MSEEWQLTFQPFLVNLAALEIYIAFVIAVGVALVITLVFGRVREGETPTKVSAGFFLGVGRAAPSPRGVWVGRLRACVLACGAVDSQHAPVAPVAARKLRVHHVHGPWDGDV